MSASRFDLFTMVHKGQRRVLFELTASAGQLGSADTSSRSRLAAEIDAFFDTMREHAHHEDSYVGPMVLKADPALAAQLQAGHQQLDEELAAIEAAVATARATPSVETDLQLYRALARLTSSYLAHVNLEETAVQQALWAAFDDAALAETQGRLVAAHKPQTVAYNLKAMLPAASSEERVRFLSGLRRNMPPAVFTNVRAMVTHLVSPAEWTHIDAG